MSDNYIYLALSASFFLVAIIFSFYRKDLRSLIIKTGIIGGVVGILSEFWYFNDYWKPPTIFGTSYFPLEDFLFGFGVTAVGATVFKVVNSLQMKKTFPSRKKEALFYFATSAVLLVIITNLLTLNSIFVSSVLFIIISTFILYQRNDLIAQSLVTALLLVGFATIIYALLFGQFSDTYLEKYFLLNDTRVNFNLFGTMPLTEMLWYFSWGMLAGTIFDYARGTSLEKTTRDTHTKSI